MRMRIALAAACVASVVAWAVAQETLPGASPLGSAPPTDARHYSYAIGQELGSNFREHDIEIDVESLAAGIRDAIAGAEPKYPEELLAVAMQRMYAEQEAKVQRQGAAYLAEHAKAPGVVVLPSGLQYRVLKQGAGPSPKATDVVRVSYVGRFIDGTVFDESGDQPAEFRANGVIRGWTEALQLMKVGDKWELAIPSDLAYGDAGYGDIPPGAVLVFEVELIGIR